MAEIPVRNFATLVGNFAAGVQGRARDLVDFSVGSVLRAVAEATADLTLWLQSLIVYVLTLTRAATSQGADLDTWYADWFFTRLPPVATTGTVTFSRFSADQAVLVPVGAEVASNDGSLVFTVYADTGNPAWDGLQQGYALGVGVLSADVPVAAAMPAGSTNATAWNASAGQINAIRSNITGIDTVANAAPFTTGIDQESDEAYRARFPLYIASLAKGTEAAIRSGVASVQQSLQAQVVQVPGHVTVVIDDGSGAPSTGLVLRALAAVDPIRAAGVWVSVIGATTLRANVQMIIEIDPAYNRQAVVARVTDSLGAGIAALGLGAPLHYTAVSHIAYGVPGVRNVTGVLVNGTDLDLVPPVGQTVKAGTLIVSAGG